MLSKNVKTSSDEQRIDNKGCSTYFTLVSYQCIRQYLVQWMWSNSLRLLAIINSGLTYTRVCVCIYVHLKCVYNVSDDPVDLLIDYFKKFGQKLCCFDDTHHFVSKLSSTADVDKVSMTALITFHVKNILWIVLNHKNFS